MLDGVKIGYLVTSVKYEKQGDEFVLVYGDAENPTTVELLSGIDLGKMLAAMNGGEGNSDSVLSVVRDGMENVSLEVFLRSLSAGPADQLAPCLHASLAHARHDLRDLLRHVLAARDLILKSSVLISFTAARSTFVSSPSFLANT